MLIREWEGSTTWTVNVGMVTGSFRHWIEKMGHFGGLWKPLCNVVKWNFASFTFLTVFVVMGSQNYHLMMVVVCSFLLSLVRKTCPFGGMQGRQRAQPQIKQTWNFDSFTFLTVLGGNGKPKLSSDDGGGSFLSSLVGNTGWWIMMEWALDQGWWNKCSQWT